MEIFHGIGIEPKLLLAQALNFGLLLFVLYRFLYAPILKMLNERSTKIEKSLKEAEEIEIRSTKAKEEHEIMIAEAKKEVAKLLKEAKIIREEMKIAIIKDAENKAEEILKKGEDNIVKEKEQMMSDIKGELAEIISKTMQVIFENHGSKLDESLIWEAVLEFKKQEGIHV